MKIFILFTFLTLSSCSTVRQNDPYSLYLRAGYEAGIGYHSPLIGIEGSYQFYQNGRLSVESTAGIHLRPQSLSTDIEVVATYNLLP